MLTADINIGIGSSETFTAIEKFNMSKSTWQLGRGS